MMMMVMMMMMMMMMMTISSDETQLVKIHFCQMWISTLELIANTDFNANIKYDYFSVLRMCTNFKSSGFLLQVNSHKCVFVVYW